MSTAREVRVRSAGRGSIFDLLSYGFRCPSPQARGHRNHAKERQGATRQPRDSIQRATASACRPQRPIVAPELAQAAAAPVVGEGASILARLRFHKGAEDRRVRLQAVRRDLTLQGAEPRASILAPDGFQLGPPGLQLRNFALIRGPDGSTERALGEV